MSVTSVISHFERVCHVCCESLVSCLSRLWWIVAKMSVMSVRSWGWWIQISTLKLQHFLSVRVSQNSYRDRDQWKNSCRVRIGTKNIVDLSLLWLGLLKNELLGLDRDRDHWKNSCRVRIATAQKMSYRDRDQKTWSRTSLANTFILLWKSHFTLLSLVAFCLISF